MAMDEGTLNIIVGTIIGALLATLGYFYKTRKEQQRTLKKALFHLLEIWYTIRIPTLLNAKFLLQHYANAFRNRFPNVEISNEDEALMGKLMGQQIGIFLKHAYQKPIHLSSSYQEVIQNLSGDAPILAFELNGNSNLQTALASLDQYWREIENDVRDEKEKVFVKEFESMVNSFAHQDVLGNLERDLRRLGRRIGISMWLRVSWKLRNQKRTQNKMIKDVISSILNEVNKTVAALEAKISSSESSQVIGS